MRCHCHSGRPGGAAQTVTNEDLHIAGGVLPSRAKPRGNRANVPGSSTSTAASACRRWRHRRGAREIVYLQSKVSECYHMYERFEASLHSVYWGHHRTRKRQLHKACCNLSKRSALRHWQICCRSSTRLRIPRRSGCSLRPGKRRCSSRY